MSHPSPRSLARARHDGSERRGRLLVLSLLAFAVVAATLRLRAYDTLWHLAAGRWILEHWAVPRVDPFRFTSHDTPWVDHEWLFQVAIAALERLGGLPALVVARTLLVVGIAAVLLRELRRAGAPLAGSPGFFAVNLRVSRSFAFGVINRKSAAGPAKPGGQATAQASTAPAGGGEKRVVGPGGPALGGGAGGGAGMKTAAVGAPPPPQGGGGPANEYRYNLNVSLSFQNLLNRVNLSPPVGNLLSPSFGQSLGLGGFGGFGGGGGSGAGNRRIYAQVRLSF